MPDLLLIGKFGELSSHLFLKKVVILEDLVLNDAFDLGEAVLLHLPFHERHLHLLIGHLLHQVLVQFFGHGRIVFADCLQFDLVELFLYGADELSEVPEELLGGIVGEDAIGLPFGIAIYLILHFVNLLKSSLLYILLLLIMIVDDIWLC